jgi:hypothetical protein
LEEEHKYQQVGGRRDVCLPTVVAAAAAAACLPGCPAARPPSLV